jgi:hypothetical protein
MIVLGLLLDVERTQASSVIPFVRSSDAASAIVTHVLLPNESADPECPVAVQMAR